jgi:soluble P-type ATPase
MLDVNNETISELCDDELDMVAAAGHHKGSLANLSTNVAVQLNIAVPVIVQNEVAIGANGGAQSALQGIGQGNVGLLG